MGKISQIINKIVSICQSGKSSEAISDAAKIVARQDHNLSRKQISPNALKVLYRLQSGGYSAYLVGGGVRDSLLGLEPKDFDVVTNAKPDEVKKLFKNSLLIGKRFRIVHIRFRNEIIEVATFRKASFNEPESQTRSNHHGMILRDNVYGTINDDVWRRDFTVNALYYNIKDFSIVDYTNGIEDLKNGVLRIIGEPKERLREDPVRLLRAVRLACKLGFKIDEATAEPFEAIAPLLQHISSARLFDETLKLFLSGCSVDTFAMLRRYDLFGILFQQTEQALVDPKKNHIVDLFILRLLSHTDERLRAGKTVNPAYLFAGMLWYPLLKRHYFHMSNGMRHTPALDVAIKDVLHKQLKTLAIPRRFLNIVREIWVMQFQFEKRFGRRPFKLLFQTKFRAGYDFLLLRAEADPNINELAQWWTAFYEGDEAARKALLEQIEKPKKKKKKKPQTDE